MQSKYFFLQVIFDGKKNQYTVIYFDDGYGNSELKRKIEQKFVSFISGMLKNFRKSNGIYLP